MLGIRNWNFCRKHACRHDESALHLIDRLSARQLVQNFRTDVFKMMMLRRLLSEERPESALFSLSDDMLIDQIIELLGSRRLHIHLERARPAGSTDGGSAQDSTAAPRAETERAVPFPISERKPQQPAASVSQPQNTPEPPTFAKNLDFAAQAATLIAAAQTGAAACYI